MPLPGIGAGTEVIAVGLSRSDILADAHERVIIGLLIALFATAATLCAAWLLADMSQIRPIRRLVYTARRLGSGDLSARTSTMPGQPPSRARWAAP